MSPYIESSIREEMLRDGPVGVGGLTFAICELVIEYMDLYHPAFQSYAEVIAALECAKLEFYRRAVVPYEKKRAKANGDLAWPGQ